MHVTLFLLLIIFSIAGEPDLADTLSKLIPAKADWYNIMTLLKVPDGHLQGIQLQRFHQVDKCLTDGLSYWLRGNTQKYKGAPKVNWKAVLTILRGEVVNLNELADKIEGKIKEEIKKEIQA